MTTGDYEHQIVTNELWVGSPGAQYWVEGGVTIGPIGPYGGWLPTPAYFWGMNRPVYGYTDGTFGAAAPMNQLATLTIDVVSGDDWNVQINANGLGLSHLAADVFSPPSRVIATGAEATDTTANSWGSSRSMAYKTLEGTWHSKWTSVTGSHASVAHGGNGVAGWENSWIRDGMMPTCD